MRGSKGYRPRFGFDIRINPDAPKKAEEKRVERCSVAGCTGDAQWRVPKARDRMDERVWLCREHLKAHNESWNYFAGMTDDEIARHCVDALVGHRPTWPLGRRGAGSRSRQAPAWSYRFEDGFAVFEEAAEPAPRPRQPQLTKGQLDALAALNLEDNATGTEVKARYKELVKRYHPDSNGGDRGTEERLRQVIKAYSHLRATGFVRKAS